MRVRWRASSPTQSLLCQCRRGSDACHLGGRLPTLPHLTRAALVVSEVIPAADRRLAVALDGAALFVGCVGMIAHLLQVVGSFRSFVAPPLEHVEGIVIDLTMAGVSALIAAWAYTRLATHVSEVARRTDR